MGGGSRSGAQYLIRFDDICPTMNWSVWEEIEPLLLSVGIKPIMAVVPDNRDPTLVAGPARVDFWGRVRQWKDRGWCIAMHGYQHVYVTSSAGVLGLNERSEFAGLSRATQKEKIDSGLHKFRSEGLDPQVWVAPAHSFDRATLTVLKEGGFRVISDGYYFRPVVDDQGLVWIPQQLWRFRRVPFGLWTVCFHVNSWSMRDVDRLRRDLTIYRERLLSIDEVLELQQPRLGLLDGGFAALYSQFLRARVSRKRSRPG
jgi:predicted deacetylase